MRIYKKISKGQMTKNKIIKIKNMEVKTMACGKGKKKK